MMQGEVRIPRIVSDMIHLMATDTAANATATGGKLAAVPIDVDLLVLEQFPAPLRWLINECAVKVNSLSFVDHYNWTVRNGLGVSKTLAKFQATEQNEIAVFAGRHAAKQGYPLPHIAAGASIQRYGALGPSRHPPRRVGAPVFRAHAKKRRFRVRVPPVIEMAA